MAIKVFSRVVSSYATLLITVAVGLVLMMGTERGVYITAFFGETGTQIASSASSELGIATLSPRGEEGGLAFHASGGSCFTAGTLIDTPDGQVAIEQLKEGDQVYSFDEDGAKIVTEVQRTLAHDGVAYPRNDFERSPLLLLAFADGSELKVTANHPLYRGDGKLSPARDFGEGNKILSDGGEKEIVTITLLKERPIVYNIETTARSQTFLANDVRVHSGLAEPSGAPSGSLILTPEGEVAIETLDEGDTVLSYDEDGDTYIETTVATVFIQDEHLQIPFETLNFELYPLLKISFTDNTTLQATANQLVQLNGYRNWVELQYVQEGDVLNGKRVAQVTERTDRPVLYKLAIAHDLHNYVLDGVVVKNQKQDYAEGSYKYSEGSYCPAVTASLSVNDSTPQATSFSGARVLLSWSSTGANSCTGSGTGFSTGGSTGSSDWSAYFTTPQTFSVSCSNACGNSDSDSVSVTPWSYGMVRLNANGSDPTTITYGDTLTMGWSTFGIPSVTSCTANPSSPFGLFGGAKNPAGGSQSWTHTPPIIQALTTETYSMQCYTASGTAGPDTATVYTKSRPDLITTGATRAIGTANPVTGIFDQVFVYGWADALYNDVSNDFPVEWEVIYSTTSTSIDSGVETFTGGIGETAGNVSVFSHELNDLFFGYYDVEYEVDLNPPGIYGAAGDVWEDPIGEEIDNNRWSGTLYFNQPDLIRAIDISPDVIRPGEEATVSWEIDVAYEINCTVRGAGVNETGIGYGAGGPSRLTDSVSTGPLYNEARYVLSCWTPSTGNIFESEAIVEVLSAVEEN